MLYPNLYACNYVDIHIQSVFGIRCLMVAGVVVVAVVVGQTIQNATDNEGAAADSARIRNVELSTARTYHECQFSYVFQ